VRDTAKIGLLASLIATLFGLGYTVAPGAALTGQIAGPWATAYEVAPSLGLAWSYLILAACIFNAAPAEKKIWATIGFSFALLYSAINSIVYFTQLTVVIPRLLQGKSAGLSVLYFEPGTFLFSVNGLAYGFMSMTALFSAFSFPRNGFDGRVRLALLAHGVIGPFIVGAVVLPALTYVGALWIITFPVMTLTLAMHFRRGTSSGAARATDY
jgi:hypothetical protein